MRACERGRWGIFLVCLLFAVRVEKTVAVDVVGTAECADCKIYSIKSTHAFSGLRVSVDCKLENGETKRIGDSDIDKDGKFKISVSHEPEHNCYANLQSTAAMPCVGGLDASKIVLKSQTDSTKTFSTSTNLHFSLALCASKTFSSYFHSHYPPLPPLNPHPWHKNYHYWPPLPPLSYHPWLKGGSNSLPPASSPLPADSSSFPPQAPADSGSQSTSSGGSNEHP